MNRGYSLADAQAPRDGLPYQAPISSVLRKNYDYLFRLTEILFERK